MNTIVLNTSTGAVSEYDWQFQSISPTHAGDAVGLYELGGDTDLGQPIAARITTARLQWGASLKKRIDAVYLSMTGVGQGRLTVHGHAGSWSYAFPILAAGVSRSVPGKGIRENYLAFSVENLGGGAFALDSIEALDAPSKTRRI